MTTSSPSKLSPPEPGSQARPGLDRRFGLLPATALNMTNMIGVGPFITIPLLMSALGGPQAMLGWLVALVIVICDGMVWSELGAAMPGSGGSFHYLREAFGRTRFGRLMAFLFVWQFVLSGPLEIASGYIGFASYTGYIWKGMTRTSVIALVVVVGLVNIALLYRRIHSIAKITVSLWVGTLLTVLAVIVTGATNFNPQIAFDFPPGAFNFSLGFFLGLGAASRVGIYDYLGYYDVCYIGDEVRDPGRVIPRSILISTAAVALIYLGINLSIVGVIPWREFVPASAHPESNFIVSTLMERVYGGSVATIFTLLILWTAFGSVFALLLGYSRIPFAAAESGYFFRAFARLHPTKGFPYVSLLVLGAISIVAGLFSLGTVIDALIVTRIVVQFMGQVVGLMLLRRHAPGMPRPFRMWLYPVPALIALFGWIFLFATTPLRVIAFGLGVLALGCIAFLLWSWRTSRWPFAVAAGCLLMSLGCTSGTPSNGPPAVSTPDPIPPVEWRLVAGDEFDGPAGNRLDETKWSYDTGDGCRERICGWGNGEKEYYTDAVENVSLNGQGQLMIVARAAPPGLSCYYGPCIYTSGRINSRGKMVASPGRVEARIKLPTGQGLWSAFWMLGHDHPSTPWPASGELDIMEHKGSQAATISSAVHGPGYSGATPFTGAHDVSPAKLTDDFHIFAIEWDAREARFFVDGIAHYSVTRREIENRGASILDRPYFLILNVAVGGHFDGDPRSAAIFPAAMLVDYVRIYSATTQ